MIRLARIATLIDETARRCGAALIVVFAGLVVYVVASRYLFSSTPRWAEELPRLLLVWVTFIGAVSACARGTHFRAGLLQLMVPKGRLRSFILICAALASGLFFAILGLKGAELAQMTWDHKTTALDLPVGLFYLSLPLTCVFGILALAFDGWRK